MNTFNRLFYKNIKKVIVDHPINEIIVDTIIFFVDNISIWQNRILHVITTISDDKKATLKKVHTHLLFHYFMSRYKDK